MGYRDVEEPLSGFHALEEHVDLPFSTMVLGVDVTVVEAALPSNGGLVAVPRRGGEPQSIDFRELPLPSPPVGGDWIHVYRQWAAGGLV